MSERQTAIVTTEHSAIIASQITSGEASGNVPEESQFIETRFGKIHVRRDNPIVFAKGLLGMPECTRYCLLEFPVAKFSQFRLLQSLDDDALSFITLPLDFDNPIIERADIEAACSDLGFSLNDTAVLLIVSVHRELQQVRLSANARAPLFLDAGKRRAEQYVLHNNKYEVRHMITG